MSYWKKFCKYIYIISMLNTRKSHILAYFKRKIPLRLSDNLVSLRPTSHSLLNPLRDSENYFSLPSFGSPPIVWEPLVYSHINYCISIFIKLYAWLTCDCMTNRYLFLNYILMKNVDRIVTFLLLQYSLHYIKIN